MTAWASGPKQGSSINKMSLLELNHTSLGDRALGFYLALILPNYVILGKTFNFS